MTKTINFWNLVKSAFNARPAGMFIPPNWIGVIAFAMLGLVNPGLWLVGCGLELGYLFWLTHHPRFRRVIEGRASGREQQEWQQKIALQVGFLSSGNQGKYNALETRCMTIIDQQMQETSESTGLQAQTEGLSRLLWIYLRLLQTQESIVRLDQGAEGERERLEERAKTLNLQLKDAELAVELRKSLTSQLDIVSQRLVKRREAKAKGTFVEAEIQRIEEQVELIREQSMLTSDPRSVSQRIDDVAATLGGTSDWIRDQQQMFGQVEDILGSSPPLLQITARKRQSI